MMTQPPHSTPHRTLAALVLFHVLACTIALGQPPPSEWTNPGSSSWFDAGNWDAGVPNNSNPGRIQNGGTAQINTGGAASTVFLQIGGSGNGNLSLTDGSLTVGELSLLPDTGQTASMQVNGAAASVVSNVNGISLLGMGNSSLSITNGGSVSLTSAPSIFYLGGLSGQAEVTVSGAVSTLTKAGGNIEIGRSGVGTLTISNGGLVDFTSTNFNVIMGRDFGGQGTINLNGTAGARGTLQARGITESASFSNQINFNGGVLRANSNNTNFISGFEAGEVNIAVGGAFIDSNGFNIEISSILSGTGRLTKEGTGILTLTGANTYTGGTTIHHGTLRVTSGSISHPSGYTRVGQDSGDNATLEITGGTVSNSSTDIAYHTGSTGTMKISNGTWTNSGAIQVGSHGNGTLEITGGTVSSNSTYIGNYTPSTGLVKVSGGTWTNSGMFVVGERGSGTLEITDGAVTSGFTTIGSDATGLAQISGGTWDITSSLTVGRHDNGTLEISGGTVTSTSTRIGEMFGSTGLVTVSGGTWNNSGSVLIGDNSDGTLEISGNGSVSASSVTLGGMASSYSPTSVLNLHGGVLSTTQVSKGSGGGSGTVNFGGGTLRLTANQANLFNNFVAGNVMLNAGGGTIDTQSFAVATSQVLSGIGSLTKEGTGTLTLSGVNTYSGGTTLSRGTLVVTNANSLGSGLLTLANGTTLSSGVSDLSLNNNLAINGDVTFSQVSNGSNTLDLNGSVSLAPGIHTISVTNQGDPRFSGVISGNAGLTISGGNVTFSGSDSNTYTGLTTVLSGANLRLSKSANQTAILGDLTLDSGGNVNVLQNNPFGAASTVTVNGLLQFQPGVTTVSIPRLLGTGVIDYLGFVSSGNLTVESGEFSGTIGNAFQSLNLIKTTSDTLILSGNNTYTGDTTISAGTLQIGNGGTTGSIIGNITNNAALIFNRSNYYTFGGIISGSGTLTKQGTGSLSLTGNNTFSGGTTLSEGSLVIGHNNAIGTGTLTIADGTALHSTAPRRITNNLVVNGDFNLFPGGTLTTFSAFELDGNMDLTGGNRTLTNTMDFNAFEFGQVNLGGVISNGGLTFTDSGFSPGDNVVFFRMDGSSANTYTGETTVGSNVSLTLAKDANVTAIAGDVTIEDEAALALLNAGQIADTSEIAFEGNGRLQVGIGADITETIGSLGDDGTGLASITLEDASTGSLLRVGSGSFSGTIEGGLAGGNSLEKYGTGILTLTGIHTYLGDTLINGGTLWVNGSLGNTAVTVNNGGTLGGSGIIGGTVTVNNGGFLTPGTSPGTLEVAALTLNNGSTTVFELGSPAGTPGVDSDLIDVGGLLTLGGGGIEIINFGGMNTGSYTLFNYGSLSGSTIPITSAPGGFNFDFIFDTPNQLLLDVNFNGLQFWDGSNTSAPSTPGGQGGSGNWANAGTNWTNQGGNANATWSDLTAVFGGGIGGTVTLGDDVAVTGLQFLADGYQIAGAGHSISSSSPFNILVESGMSATIGATLTGTGAMSKINGGTLVLTENNTYSGGTTISAGTLQLGNGGTTGMVAGNITNNANLIFDRADDYFYNGVVSGTGNFTQNRSILRLSAAQTYTGTTNIKSNSILVLPFIDQSLSSATIVDIGAGSSLDFSNSQLTLSGLTGSGTVYSFLNSNPASGNLTIDIASGTSTFDGSFGGPFPNFSITKAGAGTQIFTGNSTHTGTTTVSGGALLVNGNLGNSAVTVQNNALLGGSGTLGGNVTIESGGILAPGNSTGIITIGGNLSLNSGSITQMEINNTTPGTGHDQIVVGGNATLGGSLELFFGGGMSNGDSFTLIDTANPIIGNYDSVVNVLGNALTFSSTITDDYLLKITAIQSDFTPFAITPNQQSVANAIDDFALSGEINDLIDFMNTLPGDALPPAFDQVAPIQFSHLSNAAFAKTRFRHRGISNQLRERRSGSFGFSSSQMQVSGQVDRIDWSNSALVTKSTGLTHAPAPDASTSALMPSNDRRWGFFASGNFENIDDDRDGPGYDSDSGGFTLGADLQVLDSVIVGFHAGYEHGDLDFGRNGGDIESNTATYGLYGSWFDETGNWVDASLGGAYHRFDTTRNVLGAHANGKTHADEFWAKISYGHDFRFGSHKEWMLTPSAGIAYNHLKTDAFAESGSLAPLSLRDQSSESLRTEIGLRLEHRSEWAGATWRPFIFAGWQHEWLDTSNSVSARFSNGGSIFTVNGRNSSRNSATFGTGIHASFSETLSAGLSYNGEVNSDIQAHQIFATLRWGF